MRSARYRHSPIYFPQLISNNNEKLTRQEVNVNNKIAIAFILLLTVIGQSAVDIYLPALPHMVHDLGTTQRAVQISLTTFFIGFAVSQLFYGPLSDQYGRKPILYFGLSVFLLGSLGCVLAPNAPVLILSRLVQGLGIGAASTLSRAISRDLFDGKALSQISAYAAMSWALIPIIAPLIGSYIQHYLGWRYIFGLLALFGAGLLLLLSTKISETHPQPSANQQSALRNYQTLITHPVFLVFSFCVLNLYGVFANFNLVGPFFIQELFNQSVIVYGWLIFFVAMGYLIGSFSSSRLVNHISVPAIIGLGCTGLFLVTLVFMLLSLSGIQNLYTLVGAMFLILLCSGLIYPQFISQCLSPFPHIAGSAGALFGFMVFLGGTVFSLIISHLPHNSLTPYAILLFAQIVFLVVINLLRTWLPSKTGLSD